jgi:hypothetical protein
LVGLNSLSAMINILMFIKFNYILNYN